MFISEYAVVNLNTNFLEKQMYSFLIIFKYVIDLCTVISFKSRRYKYLLLFKRNIKIFEYI